MTTLFKKDPNNLGRVIDEINPENSWVLSDKGVKATRKFDGTSCSIIGGKLYKRYMVKSHKDITKLKPIPEGAIPCSELGAVEIETGWPHWVPCDRNNPADKYHWGAFDSYLKCVEHDFGDQGMDGVDYDGTFELCGPKVQGNPEGFKEHTLVRHGSEEAPNGKPFFLNDDWQDEYGFEEFKCYLESHDIEGIVFHHPDNIPNGLNNKYCKLRKVDFGFKRNK